MAEYKTVSEVRDYLCSIGAILSALDQDGCVLSVEVNIHLDNPKDIIAAKMASSGSTITDKVSESNMSSIVTLTDNPNNSSLYCYNIRSIIMG